MIRIGTFIGEVPKVAPRYLPDTAAQLAYNVRLNDGALTPIRIGRLDATLAAPAVSIYRHGEEWIYWSVPVNVAPGPVAQDRLYITGDGAPKVRAGGQTYDLALRAPAAAPAVDTQGTLDPDLSETVVYAYTFVTTLDEESEPSPLTAPAEWSSGMTNALSGFDPNPPARVDRMRIYRSQTGTTGATGLFFIAERPYTTADFVDNWGTYTTVEPIPSVDYNSPPNDLHGLIALPNGMMAAASGKRLYFSEPYKPHAWPESYVLTTDYPIVGLGAFGASLAVLTTGNPYVVTGSAPENMTMEKLELNLPCISARGIVDMGYAVVYPSHEGLVAISSGGASVITAETISRERWLELGPESFVSGQYGGRYMASYARVRNGEEDRGIIIVDTTGQVAHIARASDFADAMHYQIETGALYLLRAGTEIWEWDARGQPNGELVWRSKPFVLPGHTNFSFIMIEAESSVSADQAEAIRQKVNAIRARNRAMMDAGSIGGEVGGAPIAAITFAGDRLIPTEDYAGGGGDGSGYDEAVAVTVYADGVEVAVITDTNEPIRLPSDFLARSWEIEVRGNMQVLGIAMGHSPSELAAI